MNLCSKPCFRLVPNNYGTLIIRVYIRTTLDFNCVIRHLHKQREVDPATVFFRETHALLVINRYSAKSLIIYVDHTVLKLSLSIYIYICIF